jgi:hypothetical protein
MTTTHEPDVRHLEVHPEAGRSPEPSARHFFEKQGYTVLDVKLTSERCKHGHRVVAVTIYDPEEES